MDNVKSQMAGYAETCKRVTQRAKEEGKWFCFFCGNPLGEYPDHHHTKGRDGDLLTNDRYLVLAHRECHTLWHSVPHSVLERYYWWDDFQKRLNEL